MSKEDHTETINSYHRKYTSKRLISFSIILLILVILTIFLYMIVVHNKILIKVYINLLYLNIYN